MLLASPERSSSCTTQFTTHERRSAAAAMDPEGRPTSLPMQQLPSPLPQIDELLSLREPGCLAPLNQPSLQAWQLMFSQPQPGTAGPAGGGQHGLHDFLTSPTDPTARPGLPDAVPSFPFPRSFGVPVSGTGMLRLHENAAVKGIPGMPQGLSGLDALHSQLSQTTPSAENPKAGMEMRKRDSWPVTHGFSASEAANMIVFGGNDNNKYNISTGLNQHHAINPAVLKIEDGDDEMPRPSSMPSLGTSHLVADGSAVGDGGHPPRRKGRGGRTAAMDPRLDPSIDPKRAKRILANRQSAARSKNKQRGHLDTLQGTHTVLGHQKSVLLKEVAWLRAEVQGMEEESSKLEVQINALREHSVLQEALQMKLLEECGQSFSIPDAAVNES